MEVSAKIYPSFEELESINIANFIYFDGFSRNKLIHEIYKLADATDLVMIMWKKFTESHLPSGISRNISELIPYLKYTHLLIHHTIARMRKSKF